MAWRAVAWLAALLPALTALSSASSGFSWQEGVDLSEAEVIQERLGPCQDQHHSSVCVTFRAFAREFRVVLDEVPLLAGTRSTAMLPGGIVVPINITTHQWYMGHLAGEQASSHVRFTVAHGLFYGAVHTYNTTYLINRAELDGEDALIISIAEDHQHHQGPACGSPKVHRVDDPAHLDALLHHDQRRREVGPPSSIRHTVCPVFLDADATFFEHWGGVGTESQRLSNTVIKMVDIFYQVDGLYNVEQNLQGILSLRIAGTKVFVDKQFTSSGGTGDRALASGTLTAYQQFLAANPSQGNVGEARGAGQLTAQDVCLNHLFVHENLGGVLGVAIQASPRDNIFGGLCESRLIDGLVLNAGLTSTMSSNGVVYAWQSALSTAHEIGHNLGAEHDCELAGQNNGIGLCENLRGASECVPSDGNGGAFLMFPSVGANDQHTNARLLSTCSLDSVFDLVQRKGACLEEPGACASGGSCCIGETVLPEGSICRPAPADSQCVASAVCDGVSSACPAFRLRPENTPCVLGDAAGTLGACSAGECVHIHDPFCKAVGLRGCTLHGHECVRACAPTATSDACFAYEFACQLSGNGDDGAIRWWSDTSVCPAAPIGTGCTAAGQAGECDAQGVCEACAGRNCTSQEQLLGGDTVAVECTYRLDQLAPCSQPCGGGLQASTYICTCNDGAIDPSGTLCGGVAAPSATEACRALACDTLEPLPLTVILNTPADSSTLSLFAVAARDALGYTVQIVAQSSGAETLVLDIESCQNGVSTTPGCLSRERLAADLEDPATRAALERGLGSAVQLVKGTNSDSGATTTLILIVSVSILVFGVLVAVSYHFWHTAKTSKAHRTRYAAGSAHHGGGASRPVARPPAPYRMPLGLDALYRVVHAFEASVDDELDLRVGDEVLVVARGLDEGWMLGRLGDRFGVFPQDFVDPTPVLYVSSEHNNFGEDRRGGSASNGAGAGGHAPAPVPAVPSAPPAAAMGAGGAAIPSAPPEPAASLSYAHPQRTPATLSDPELGFNESVA